MTTDGTERTNNITKENPSDLLRGFLDEYDKAQQAETAESAQPSSSLSAFEQEVEEERKKAENMSEEELNDLLRNITATAKESAAQPAPYIKEFPPDYVNAYEQNITEESKTDSVADGLIRSLSNLGAVNIEYISAVTGKTAQAVITELTATDSIFQNPLTWGEKFSEGWESANEYLSGNLFRKHKAAKEAAIKYGIVFERNVRAIEKLLGNKISSDGIYATLGSPWIPASVYNEFFYQTFRPKYKRKDGIFYDDIVKCWKITYVLSSGYDVPGMSAVEILERTLNNRPIEIYQKHLSRYIKYRPLDKEATMQAVEVQKKLVALFRAWLFNDEERKAELEQLYFELYGSITARKFNGSFLELPGKNPAVKLYKHQLDAIARIILTPATLLAHAVGTGKTYIMIAAGMEMRRTGLSKKNMYVIPKPILGQWLDDFRTLYPLARVLVADEHNMCDAKREQTLKQIKEGDYDAVLITYKSFERIPAGIRSQIAELRERIDQVGNQACYNSIKMDCFKKIAELDKQKREMGDQLSFEDLGITSLFVDEAHNFKNVTLTVNAAQLGLTRGGAKCADDMFTKVKIVRKNKECKSIVFATGTPVTNSITELYVMQSYLQPGDLRFLKLDSFDNWALTFGEKSLNFEIDVDSSHYRMVERFNRFHNLPELTNLFAGVADFHLEEMDEIFTRQVDYKTITVPRSAQQEEYIKTLAERTESIRGHQTLREEDNLLTVTQDGRKAALDIRLVCPACTPTQTKTDYCAEQVYQIYSERPEVTQLVFCDLSTPKSGFNVYDDLRAKLIAKGIPSCEIEYVQSAKSNKHKKAVFDCVNHGRIRILLGSTPTLGTGVNVQKKLYAVHHLDVPWKPSEMVQREGRMIRQGNENNNVEVYRYVTAGSFDSYSWQLLESKQKFICQLLSGSFDERDGEELNELVLTYAEIKALAIGDPQIKDRVETANELDRLKLLKTSMLARREYLGAKAEELPKEIQNKKRYVQELKNDYRVVSAHLKSNYRETGEKILEAMRKPLEAGGLTYALTYRGIDIFIPEGALETYPRVILGGQHEKLINLKSTEGKLLSAVGIMQKIDDYYDGLLDYIKENSVLILQKEKELEQVRAELSGDLGDIDEHIARLKKHLDVLDVALGIEKDGKR